MNHRCKVTAALLALFLGPLGAHWYYLGDTRAGTLYLTLFIGSLLLMLLPAGAFVLALVGLMSLLDFINMLSMEPATFNTRWNA